MKSKNFNPQLHLLFLLCIVFSFHTLSVNAQSCYDATLTQSDFCTDQRAEIRIDDANTDVQYGYYWERSPGDLVNQGYGYQGDNRYYLSNFPMSGTNPETFYYVQGHYNTAGPAYRAPGGGASVDLYSAAYQMPFDASMNFALDSVTVVVELTDPAATYMMEVMHINGTDTVYSPYITGAIADFENISGDLYRVRFATTGIEIPVGTGQILEFRSITTPDFKRVENVYWWSSSAYSGSTYANGNITTEDPQQIITGNPRVPLIMDWSIRLLCDPVEVPLSLSTDCCTPVGEDFSLLTSSTQNLFRPNELPIDVTAEGTDLDPSFYYAWYDENGTAILEGVNETTLSAASFGRYSLRVVEDAADINSGACYGLKNIILDTANIFIAVSGDACGSILSLEASGGIADYTWAFPDLGSAGSASDFTGSTSTLTMTTSGTYTVEVTGEAIAGELAVDGTFAQYDPRTDEDIITYPPRFETTYGNPMGHLPGKYGPGKLQGNGEMKIQSGMPIDEYWNDNRCPAASYYERTDPNTNVTASRGQFLLVDGHTSGSYGAGTVEHAMDKYIWQMTNIPVQANTDYNFYMDVSNWNDGNAPDMMMLVNGVPLSLSNNGTPTGSTVFNPVGACNWHIVGGVWNSGSNTTATFTISEIGKQDLGHELALDNITINTGTMPETASIEVEVNLPNVPTGIEICQGTDGELEVADNQRWNWLESDASTLIGTEDGGPVTWDSDALGLGTQTLFIQSAESSGENITVGLSTYNGFSYVSDANQGQTPFNAHSSIILHSVDAMVSTGQYQNGCSAAGSNYDVTLAVFQNGIQIPELSYVFTVNCVSSPAEQEFTIPVEFNIPAGTGYELRIIDYSGTNIPFKVIEDNQPPILYDYRNNELITIYQDNGNQQKGGVTFNWVIEEVFACAPAAVEVEIISCCNNDDAVAETIGDDTKEVCEDEPISLTGSTLNAANGDEIFHWSGPNGFDLETTDASITVASNATLTHEGWYTVELTRPGCTSPGASDRVFVQVNPNPGSVSGLSTSDVCSGTSINYTVSSTDADGFNWQLPSGASITTSNTDSSAITVDYTGATTGSLIATAYNSCNTSEEIAAITVNPLPTTPVWNAEENTLCQGTSGAVFTIEDQGSVNYNWNYTGTGGTINGTSNSITLDLNSTSTSGDVTISVENNCGSSASILSAVTVNPAIGTVTDNLNQTLCSGDIEDYTVSANNVEGFYWSLPTGATATASNSDSSQITIDYTGASSGTLKVTAYNSCGSESDEATITINSIPDASSASVSPSQVCKNSASTFTATGFTGSIDDYIWTISSNGSGLGSDATNDITFNQGPSGSVSVTANNECGSSLSIDITVTVDSIPNITDHPTPLGLCLGSDAVFTVTAEGPSPISYNWLKDGNPLSPLEANSNLMIASIEESDGGNYSVEISNNCGTIESEIAALQITLTEFPSVELYTNDNEICEGETVSFTALGSGTGSNPTYTFYNNSTGVIISGPGPETSYNSAPLNADIEVYVELNSTSTCIDDAATNPVNSDPVNISVSNNPDPVTITEGDFNTCIESEGLTNSTVTTGTPTWSDDNVQVSVSATSPSTAAVTGIPAETTITVYLTNSTGGICPDVIDSVKITRLGELTSPDAGDTIKLCEDETPPTLSPTSVADPSKSEIALWYAEGPAVIDATVGSTSNLTIGPNKFFYTINNGACEATDSVIVWNDSIPSVGTTVNAGSDDEICVSSYTLKASNIPSSMTGLWSGGNFTSNTETQPNGEVINLTTGTTTLTWTVTNGACLASDEVNITKFGELTSANAGQDDSTCISSGTSYTLNANSPNTSNSETARWFDANATGLSFTSADAPSSTVQNLQIGINTIGWIMENPSCPSDTDYISIYVFEEPSAAIINSGNDTTICDTSVFITVTSNPITVGSGLWSGSNNLSFNQGTNSTEIRGLSSGANTVNYTVSNGVCTPNQGSITITSITPSEPSVNIAVEDDEICKGDNALISVTDSSFGGPNPTFEWTVNGSSVGDDNAVFTSSTLENADQICVVMTTSFGCVTQQKDEDCASITVADSTQPTIQNTSPIQICETTNTTLTAGSTQTGTTLTWSTGETGSSIELSSPFQSGEYTVTEDNGVCPPTASNIVTVIIDEMPVPNAGENQQLFLDESPTTLNGSAPIGTIEWSPADFLNDVTIANPTFSPLEGGIYDFTMTVTNGACSNSSETKVTILIPVTVPSAFSPNSDGINDDFEILGINTYPNNNVKIFNRWGQLIYEAWGYGDDNMWSGTNNGKSLPTGTYYYVIDLNEVLNPIPLKGYVELLK